MNPGPKKAHGTAAPQPRDVAKRFFDNPEWIYGLLFIVFALVLYWQAFTFPAFGPEFAAFYALNSSRDFLHVLQEYFRLGKEWYRPTAFYTPYWIAEKFVGWHHIAMWRLINFGTLLLACWALYRFALLLFPGERRGAVLACIYYAAHPAMFVPLFEVSAFDFPHVFFALLSVALFIRAWRADDKTAFTLVLWGAAAYILALTSKETTFPTPLYAAAAAFTMSLPELRKGTWRRFARRSAILLGPYFIVFSLYVLLHVARMPERPKDSAYRTKANQAMLLENTRKYPLWMVRVFEGTGDTQFQAQEHANPWNDILGLVLLMAVAAQWSLDWKSVEYRSPGILLVMWIGVFLSVPIYAGTYLWHLNLALCGYAVLLGVAVSRFLGSLPSAAVRRFGLIGFCGSLLLLGKVNFDACLTRGVHRLAYMLNTTEVITHPPVPAERLGQKPLIYIEDRLGLGRWNYGSSYLFSFAYLNLEIEQVTVPPLAQMPGELIGNWFQRKNAFFFRYDDQFKWRDATAEFASHTIGRLTQYTNELFAKGRGKEVPAILAPVMDRLANDGIARYHYALGLQMQGKTEEALKEYATAERIMPRFFFIFFNRGRMFADLHRNKEACADYKRAVSLDGSNVTAAQMVRETCH